ncbi:MAG: hypothetical protein QXE05_08310 [Nitrososphaeria archaeon]
MELVKAKPVLDEYAFSKLRLRNIETLPPKTLKNMKGTGLIKEEKKTVSIMKEIRALLTPTSLLSWIQKGWK